VRKAVKVLVGVVAVVVVLAVPSVWQLMMMVFDRFASTHVAYLIALVHRPITYEIAEPYQGWVIVTYKKPGCKPLDRNAFSLVVHVDKSGRGCTSDPDPLDGWRRTEFVYVSENGSKRLISQNMISALSNRSSDAADPRDEAYFFVGTSEALKSAWAQEPGR
jgi:hypothetical protein